MNVDAAIDEALLESFPASDPPSWTPGITQPAVPAGNTGRPRSHSRFWSVLLEWLGAASLVPLLALALVAIGIPLVLVVRWVVSLLNWVASRW